MGLSFKSLTEGYCDWGTRFHPYSIKLQELLDKNYPFEFTVVNHGVSGEKTISMVKRITKLKIEHNLKYAIVLGGTNDLHFVLASDIFDNLSQIHNFLRDNGVTSIAVTIPETLSEGRMSHIGDNRKETNRLLTDYCTRNDIPLFDLATKIPNLSLTEAERDKFWDDNLHFSPHGYDTFGELLFELLNPLLKK